MTGLTGRMWDSVSSRVRKSMLLTGPSPNGVQCWAASQTSSWRCGSLAPAAQSTRSSRAEQYKSHDPRRCSSRRLCSAGRSCHVTFHHHNITEAERADTFKSMSKTLVRPAWCRAAIRRRFRAGS